MRPTHRSPLAAYREDLASCGMPSRFGTQDMYWLLVANTIHHLGLGGRSIGTSGAAAGAFRSILDSDPAPAPGAFAERGRDFAAALEQLGADTGAADLLSEHVRAFAAEAEEAGALRLADALLVDLQRVPMSVTPLERGQVLLQLGRIARTMGDLEAASEWCRLANALGRRSHLPWLCIRAALADGIVARTRGNYPRARKVFANALALAQAHALPDLIVHAHQSLMVTAGTARDFGLALEHGWAALRTGALDQRQRVELLINLAQLCAEAGYPRAALGGHLHALELSDAPRARLPALSGAVVAAAQLAERGLFDRLVSLIHLTVRDSLPYESARALEALARAHLTLDEREAAAAAGSAARLLARTGGFFEVIYALEHVDATPTPIPRLLTPASIAIVRSIEAWTHDEHVLLEITDRSTA